MAEPKFKFIELFAGIGSQRIALESCGGLCVFSNDINNIFERVYEENFREKYTILEDFRNISIEHIPDHEILSANPPCPVFSTIGFDKDTLGSIHKKFIDIILRKKPVGIVYENVRGVYTNKSFNAFINEIIKLGYSVSTEIVQANKFVPMNKQMLYLIGLKEGETFQFPKIFHMNAETTLTIKNILEKEIDRKYILTKEQWNRRKLYEKNAKKHTRQILNLDSKAGPITLREFRSMDAQLVMHESGLPRKFTPRECSRLMGFQDKYELPLPDTLMIQSLTSSVVIPVHQAICEEVVKLLTERKKLENINSIHQDLGNRFKNYSPEEFESFIADLFENMGYQTQITPHSNDQGADIIARKNNDTIVIEVKRYREGNNVGSPVVRSVLGSMPKYNANKAIIVTTSDFTVEAEEQAKGSPVELWNFDSLSDLVIKYKI